jgi:hypothetical protein
MGRYNFVGGSYYDGEWCYGSKKGNGLLKGFGDIYNG